MVSYGTGIQGKSVSSSHTEFVAMTLTCTNDLFEKGLKTPYFEVK
jgi:hypothetical protein